ncbi:MAG TPA: ring-opening amidohydrolase [Rhodocyclaceae bacterium]|nr:ring-opening amidohydrolase [Rhodocyclaceae bacterium]
MQNVGVYKILCGGPSDLTEARSLIESGTIDPAQIVAVLGKTEGNGCVNDFTREFATYAWCTMLAPYLGASAEQVAQRIAFVMSGGTEGILSPHFTIFTRTHLAGEPAVDEKRLALGIGFTRDFLPEEIGRLTQIEETARAVQAAMADAGIADVADVHFVQIKCPLLTSAKIADVLARGLSPVTHDSYESMGLSRAASALGVALALHEVDAEVLTDDMIGRDWAHYSSVASTSAGIELDSNVIILMGMSRSAVSPYVIDHGVMDDAIDRDNISACLSVRMGFNMDRGCDEISERVVNVFAKAEAAPDGRIRGVRHTMLNDSDINSTRHARAAVGAVLASVTGQTSIYVSGGAEHQGPPGGGPFAIIARV